MDSYLSDCKLDNLPNRRNGKLTKTIKTDTGSFELATPRDRDSSFEPEIVKKRQTVAIKAIKVCLKKNKYCN